MTTYAWTVAVDPRDVAGEAVATLLVLPLAVAEHWRPRMRVLGCATWGQVKALGQDLYREVLGLAGYEGFEEMVAHFAIQGQAPGLSPSVTDEAEQVLLADEGPPDDDAAFAAYEDLGACADGDWPPSINYLIAEYSPREVVDEYADTWMTVFNGRYARFPGDARDDVLARLRQGGHQLVETPWLTELFVE